MRPNPTQRGVEMLIVSRKAGEAVEIRPRESGTGEQLVEMWTLGAIKVHFLKISSSRVKIAIEAPPELEVRRLANVDGAAARPHPPAGQRRECVGR